MEGSGDYDCTVYCLFLTRDVREAVFEDPRLNFGRRFLARIEIQFPSGCITTEYKGSQRHLKNVSGRFPKYKLLDLLCDTLFPSLWCLSGFIGNFIRLCLANYVHMMCNLKMSIFGLICCSDWRT
jgi:hypothetical protein